MKSGDLISRQAAMAKLFALYEYQRSFDPAEAADLVRHGIFLAEKKIDELPSAQPERRIPCDKGEPKEDMECWVTVKTTDTLYRGIFTKRYGERRDKGFIISGDFMRWNTALAWMPIYEPEPYRTEGDYNHEG